MSNKTEVLSFDEFLAGRGYLRGYKHDYQTSYDYGYEAGQQSKQAEVNELIDTIKTSAESEMYLFDELQKVKGERDDLQKMVDEISNHVEINYDENRDDDSHSYWSGYNQALRELFEILKGEETK